MLKKVFGGVRLTWPRLLLLSVAMGVVGALAAMLVPDGWSLHEIAVHLEFWILCAIFIITNCGSAKEAAVKTFVFFLISQPLIYLIQVPFSWMGWQIFQFYPYWLIITVLTLPGAFIGWYIKRNDLLSGLILSVMLAALVCFGVGYLKDAVGNFPATSSPRSSASDRSPSISGAFCRTAGRGCSRWRSAWRRFSYSAS